MHASALPLNAHAHLSVKTQTKWNDHMSYMLGPALVSYEAEKVSGAPLGSVERLWRDRCVHRMHAPASWPSFYCH